MTQRASFPHRIDAPVIKYQNDANATRIGEQSAITALMVRLYDNENKLRQRVVLHHSYFRVNMAY